ncbi:MAG: nucleotidyl transferase [Actinomycetia bacterium]|jgi:NDP-sugar pyrophosphorylase family protein|nr:nucleotidyl transferase [Actinomycetes bacterium]MDQ1651726.1 N-acetyl-alpha-D-muramate 1-phosphate uridylyltransferase [Cryptosporangiaceae bacterium]MDQ1656433.1 N-acetyl-alpha-D-muramate 1-phosphate uridylyltransferase [Cryptosporangiaceae bacterium]
MTREADLCAVVLAAGAGTRLAPLTDLRPKALCPIGRRTLLDRTLDRLASLGFASSEMVAVNAHHHADQVVQAVGHRAHISVEQPEALGTAGAIGALRDWIDGRDVLVCNADAYLADAEIVLTEDWGAEQPRLLAVSDPLRSDFDHWRFAGMSLLPAPVAESLEPVPGGLYEVVWRHAWAESTLEVAPFEGFFVDCGSPSDYLLANLHATGGGSAVGAGAVVEGRLTRSVVWPGGYVGPDEDLVEVIRVGRDITVPAPLAALPGIHLPRHGMQAGE